MSAQTISTDRPGDLSTRQISVAARSIPEEAMVVDAAIKELRSRGYVGLRTLTCEYHEGMLILRGVVSSYFLKQLAREAVHKIEKVNMIVDAVEVVASQPLEQMPRDTDS